MKKIFRTITILTLLFPALAAHAEISVQSFQAWKTSRVEDARTILEKVQAERPSAVATRMADRKALESSNKTEAGSTRLQTLQKPVRGDQKLQQANLNLEVAQELTINDYFVLYLSQFKTREAFIEAAKKLNPEEAADLMMSYQKHLTSSAPGFEDLGPSASGLGNALPSKQN